MRNYVCGNKWSPEMGKSICFNRLEKGMCYRHTKNKKFFIKIKDIFSVNGIVKYIIEHVWVGELQVANANLYTRSYWKQIPEEMFEEHKTYKEI